MKNSYITELTDKNFKEKVLLSDKIFLVDFWAEWCHPCQLFASILEDVSKEYFEKIFFGKINIDLNKNTPNKYAIRGIPTVLLFYKSNVIATKVGVLSRSELKKFLNKNLEKIEQ